MKGSAPKVVVDASVAVKWVIPEDYSEEALMLLRDHLEGRVEAYAPGMMLVEAASALRRYVLRGILGGDKALQALGLIRKAGVSLVGDGDLAGEALRLSLELGVTVYDAAYLALAARLGAVFYTADEKLLSNPAVEATGLAKHIHSYPEGLGSRKA
jgi:predicted nucleic acid-binding protein